MGSLMDQEIFMRKLKVFELHQCRLKVDQLKMKQNEIII